MEGPSDTALISPDGGAALLFTVLKPEKVFVGVCNAVRVKNLSVVLITLDDRSLSSIWRVTLVVCAKDVLLEFTFEVFFGLPRDSKNAMQNKNLTYRKWVCTALKGGMWFLKYFLSLKRRKTTIPSNFSCTSA